MRCATKELLFMNRIDQKLYLTPNDFPCGTDREAIQTAIAEAVRQDIRRVVIPVQNCRTGTDLWQLDGPVYLPNGITVILDGAVVLCEGTAFINVNAESAEKPCLANEQYDIFLIGRHGGTIRGLGNAPQVVFRNMRKFRIDGLTLEGGGGIDLEHTRHGRLLNLRLRDTVCGVIFREGCRNLILENLNATTKEETIRIQGGNRTMTGRDSEITNLILCRMQTGTLLAPAVSLSADAVRISNVVIRDLTDRSASGTSIRIGAPGNAGEIRDITVRGVDTDRTAVETAVRCDGMYYAGLHTSAAVSPLIRIAENTRELWDDDDVEIVLPKFPQEQEDKPYLTPNQPEFFGDSDSETIQNVICAASERGINRVVIPRWNMRANQPRWDIGQTIKLPSDMTVELWGCHMRMEDFSCCNMFANSLCHMTETRTAAHEQKNITITGVGDAVLDGGNHNGVLEKTSGKYGNPGIGLNQIFRFINVTGLVIENLHICRQRFYGVCMHFCDHGRVSNLDFYSRELVPNLDGVDLRPGCHHFTVENITGTVSDDVVALNNLGNNLTENKRVVGKEIHTHHVMIRNIMADACRWNQVRLLTHDGIQITDITIDTIMDASLSELKKQPLSCVCIGSPEYFMEYPSGMEDLSRITIRDVYSRSERVLKFGGCSSHVSARNCHSFGDGLYWIVDVRRSAVTDHIYGKGFFYRPDQKSLYLCGPSKGPSQNQNKGMLFSLMDWKGNAVFEDIFADRCEFVAWVLGEAELELKNLQVQDCDGAIPFFAGPDCKLTVNGTVVPCSDSIPASQISRIRKWNFR